MLICIPISSILQFINSKINWTFFSSITSRSRNFNSIIWTSVYPKKSDKQYLLLLSPPRVMQKKAHRKNWPCKIWGRVTLDGLSKNRVMLMFYPNKDPFFFLFYSAPLNGWEPGLPYTTRAKITCCDLNSEYKNIQFCEDIC